MELQPPLQASPSLHDPGSFLVASAAAPEGRSAERRRRLWEGPGGAGSWRGFLRGPAERYETLLAGQEYSINLKYWRRLFRIMRIALADPLTAFLAVLCAVFSLSEALMLATTVLQLVGTVSSTTLTYMRLLSPRSPVRAAVESAGLPANITRAILEFQDEASRAAKANLWWPPGPYTGVGSAAKIKPPPSWSAVLDLPADLWSSTPPTGYVPSLGVVGSFFAWVAVVTLLSGSVQLLGGAVIVRARVALTKHLHKRLFARQAFYNTVVLNPALDNYDQRITDDLSTTLTGGLGRIFGSLTVAAEDSLLQALLSIVFNLNQALIFVDREGGKLPALFWTLAIGCSLLALASYTFPMNRVSRLLFAQKKCEGDLRWLHCHLMQHSETVAFYGGEAHEEAAADRAFGRVYSTAAKLFLHSSLLVGVAAFFEGGLLPAMSLSVLYFGHFSASAIFTLWGNLNFGFRACLSIPRLVMQLSASGGPCHRVGVLLEELERQAQMAEAPRRQPGWRLWARRPECRAQQEPLLVMPGERSLQGMVVEETRNIEVRSLCLAPPGSPELVLFQGLTLVISPGESTAIIGPSGCGKSSLLRVLAGLWQPLSGVVRVPKVHGRGGIFFLPQRSYTRRGTLQEQVTYPLAAAADDAERVKDVLAMVGLGQLLLDCGLDAVVDWPTALGAGELQKLAFARLLFHQPTFALMDEATSGMDLRSEARVLQLCEAKGITAISVCHRPSAAGFHKRLLRYTGQFTGVDRDPSSWRLQEVASEDRTNAGALAEAARSAPLELSTQPAQRMLGDQGAPSDESGEVGVLFFQRLRRLLRLAFPTSTCCAARCLRAIVAINCFESLFLICGTLFAGRAAEDISNLDATGGKYPARTKWCLAYFLAVPPLIFLTNFGRTYFGQMLSLHVRRCATNEGHLLYFGRAVAFAMNSRRDECLPGRGGLQPDQRLQQDLAMLVENMATCLFGGLAVNGVVGAGIQLAIGLTFACCLTWLVSAFVLALTLSLLFLEYLSMLPVSTASMRLQVAEGSFRVAHARVREFAESIVFNGGQVTESVTLDRILSGHLAKRGYQVVAYTSALIMTSNVVAFLLATIPPVLVSMVVFYWGPEDWGGSQITPATLGSAQTFFSAILVQTTCMAASLASFGAMAGLTHRVGGFLDAASTAADFVQREHDTPQAAKLEQGRIVIQDLTVAGHAGGDEGPAPSLIESLSLQVEAGKGLLISGDSGSGKSSLMRALAGLRPPSSGVLKRPPLLSVDGSWRGETCMFVPQASYAVGGTLRDEVAYPSAAAVDDARAGAALEAMGLAHLGRREGLGRAASWATELSGGELQRLGLARVLYHCPTFALLDDATSALDAATERRCLGALRGAGVTLVTVSHREGLGAFHVQRLRLGGRKAGGKWTLEQLEEQGA